MTDQKQDTLPPRAACQLLRVARHCCLFVGALPLLHAASVAAALIPTANITNNATPNVASQLAVDVSQANVAADEVRFKVDNLGPVSSNLTEVYWDDDLNLLSTPTLLASDTTAGVGFQFSVVNPGNLPSGATIGFVADFGADEGKVSGPGGTDPGTGIGAGQMAAFKFNLAGATTLQDVLDAITAGDLRIGFHVRSIDGGTSDSFVTVPEPTSLVLASVSLAAFAVRRRRFLPTAESV